MLSQAFKWNRNDEIHEKKYVKTSNELFQWTMNEPFLKTFCAEKLSFGKENIKKSFERKLWVELLRKHVQHF